MVGDVIFRIKSNQYERLLKMGSITKNDIVVLEDKGITINDPHKLPQMLVTYQCKNCGGPLNPWNLKCEYCDTYYQY